MSLDAKCHLLFQEEAKLKRVPDFGRIALELVEFVHRALCASVVHRLFLHGPFS